MRQLLSVAFLGLVLAACGSGDDPSLAGDDTTTVPGGSASAIPGGGLTVQEAIDSDLDGPLMVAGYVVVEGDVVKLCEALAESYPPQCGGASLAVEGLDLDGIDGLQREGDRAWTDATVSVLGEVADGTITVSATSAYGGD